VEATSSALLYINVFIEASKAPLEAFLIPKTDCPILATSNKNANAGDLTGAGSRGLIGDCVFR
jgi:hypothetical protein